MTYDESLRHRRRRLGPRFCSHRTPALARRSAEEAAAPFSSALGAMGRPLPGRGPRASLNLRRAVRAEPRGAERTARFADLEGGNVFDVVTRRAILGRLPVIPDSLVVGTRRRPGSGCRSFGSLYFGPLTPFPTASSHEHLAEPREPSIPAVRARTRGHSGLPPSCPGTVFVSRYQGTSLGIDDEVAARRPAVAAEPRRLRRDGGLPRTLAGDRSRRRAPGRSPRRAPWYFRPRSRRRPAALRHDLGRAASVAPAGPPWFARGRGHVTSVPGDLPPRRGARRSALPRTAFGRSRERSASRSGGRSSTAEARSLAAASY